MTRLRLDDELVAALRQHRARGGAPSFFVDAGAVAVYASFGGAFFVTLDGRVIEEDWETQSAVVLTDEVRIREALVLGAGAVPELARLIPSRPEAARDCATCSATGWRMRVPHRFICRECGGVGWKAG
jgi:hypothetical protein